MDKQPNREIKVYIFINPSIIDIVPGKVYFKKFPKYFARPSVIFKTLNNF